MVSTSYGQEYSSPFEKWSEAQGRTRNNTNNGMTPAPRRTRRTDETEAKDFMKLGKEIASLKRKANRNNVNKNNNVYSFDADDCRSNARKTRTPI